MQRLQLQWQPCRRRNELDDNTKLWLVSGESAKMSGEMTMMVEVEDLRVASPARSRHNEGCQAPTCFGQ